MCTTGSVHELDMLVVDADGAPLSENSSTTSVVGAESEESKEVEMEGNPDCPVPSPST